MKARKITVVFTAEVLSFDAVPAIMQRAILEIDNEVREGSLSMDDGDCVTWSTSSMDVFF